MFLMLTEFFCAFGVAANGYAQCSNMSFRISMCFATVSSVLVFSGALCFGELVVFALMRFLCVT